MKGAKWSIFEGTELRCISEDLVRLRTAWNIVDGVVSIKGRCGGRMILGTNNYQI